MPFRRLARLSRLVSPAVLTACALAAVAGCEGHGKYTSDGIERAQQRVGVIKAGTQWDMAQQQFLAGDLAKALASVEQSLSLAPDVPKALTLRGRILIELGQLEQALASFDKAIEKDASFVDAYYYKGIVKERFSDPEGALECYQAAANLDASNPQYAIATAEMMIDLGRLDDAKALLQNKKSSFEHNAGVRQTLGHVAMMQGEAEAAVKLFSEARLLAPDELALLEDLAMAQIASGRFAEAEYSLRRLLDDQKNTKRRDLLHAQARCLVELDRPVEAREILLGLTSDEQGKNDLAAWSDLGKVALKLGDMARVRIVAGRLISIAPTRPDGHVLMAAALRRKGDLAGALVSLDKATRVAGGDATPWLMRGLVLQEMGRTREASEAIAHALSIDPNAPIAKRIYAAVNTDQ